MAYIQIDTPTGGSGTYQASTTYYSTQAAALAGAFATITLGTQYLTVPNGTWWVAMRDANNISNVVAKSIVVSCTTTTTTTAVISAYVISSLGSAIGSSSSNPATLSYAAPSNTNILVLQIAAPNTANSTRSGGVPSWNGIPMVEADNGGASSGYRSEIWYLTHPPTGTLSVSIPNTSSTLLYNTLSSYSSAGAMSCVYYTSTTLATNTAISMPSNVQLNADNLIIHTCAVKNSTTALLTTGTFTYSDNAISLGVNSIAYGYLMQYRAYYTASASAPMTLTINTTKISDNSLATFSSVATSTPIFSSSPSFPGPDTNTSVTMVSTLTKDGGSAITARGICYAVFPTLPTTASPKVTITNSIGTFTSNITSLSPNTTYYFNEYATNTSGTVYNGSVAHSTTNITTTTTTTAAITTTTTTRVLTTTTTTRTITTTTTTAGPTAPTVNTGTAGAITYNSIQVNSNQSINNGSSITSYGLVFSNYHTSPTLADSFVSSAGDPGSGLWNMNTGVGLTPSTIYYIRAFATNGIGTSYGSPITVSTVAATTTTTTTIPSYTYTVYGSCTSSSGIFVYYKLGAGGTWTLAGSASPASSLCPGSSILNIISVPQNTNLYIAGRSSSGTDATFGVGASACSSSTGYFGEATPYIKFMSANFTEYVTLA